MKKIPTLALLSIVYALPISFAEAAFYPETVPIAAPRINTGFYAGINLGSSFVNAKTNLTYPLGRINPTEAEFHLAYNSFFTQALLGYNFALKNQWGLALEGNVNANTGHASFDKSNWFFATGAHSKQQVNWGAGLFLLPNYQYTDSVRFFVGPGILANKFKTSSSFTAGDTGVTGNFDKWLNAWGIKVGTEIAVTQRANLVLSYQFAQYNDVQWTAFAPLSRQALRARYKPMTNTLSIGLNAYL